MFFLVKSNCNFHRFLRHYNLLDFFKHDNFSTDAHKMVIKLMKYFSNPLKSPQEQEKLSVDV